MDQCGEVYQNGDSVQPEYFQNQETDQQTDYEEVISILDSLQKNGKATASPDKTNHQEQNNGQQSIQSPNHQSALHAPQQNQFLKYMQNQLLNNSLTNAVVPQSISQLLFNSNPLTFQPQFNLSALGLSAPIIPNLQNPYLHQTGPDARTQLSQKKFQNINLNGQTFRIPELQHRFQPNEENSQQENENDHNACASPPQEDDPAFQSPERRAQSQKPDQDQRPGTSKSFQTKSDNSKSQPPNKMRKIETRKSASSKPIEASNPGPYFLRPFFKFIHNLTDETIRNCLSDDNTKEIWELCIFSGGTRFLAELTNGEQTIINVWGYFSWRGVGPLYIYLEPWNETKFDYFLRCVMIPWARKNVPDDVFLRLYIQQQYWAPKFNVLLNRYAIQTLELNSSGSHISPVDYLWDVIQLKSWDEIETAIRQLRHNWESIPLHVCRQVLYCDNLWTK